ncbi:MAG: undecaprenyl-diphosphate phosphatase [Lachnospiraceae bacterium]|nr:undecaprenyl-diphosphate phosphatase [Candidatus Equihabitans merdae]
MLEVLKVILLGIVEGITEWLPISSTGHMILLDEFVHLNVSEAFMEMFLVVIQLGAILAVVVLFWNQLWPFHRKNPKVQGLASVVSPAKITMWLKIAVSCLPAVVIGLPFDDFLEEHFYNYVVVAIMLIIYGILFILVENYRKGKRAEITKIPQITWKTALLVGVFQVLALIPGTSRSGATILGGLLLGMDRRTASRYTFFLAIPVMAGASLLKLVKFGFHYTGLEVFYLLLGMAVAFLVSLFAIKFLMNYVKKHDFKAFGIYRIVLGIIVLAYFIIAH